ncbi:hypothetical protein BC835DRAFT_1307638 [Cytidiella melzeri]|nr:hypothetical protein BC835DRAFT_1307638 [Cytidiella melzeri]
MRYTSSNFCNIPTKEKAKTTEEGEILFGSATLQTTPSDRTHRTDTVSTYRTCGEPHREREREVRGKILFIPENDNMRDSDGWNGIDEHSSYNYYYTSTTTTTRGGGGYILKEGRGLEPPETPSVPNTQPPPTTTTTALVPFHLASPEKDVHRSSRCLSREPERDDGFFVGLSHRERSATNDTGEVGFERGESVGGEEDEEEEEEEERAGIDSERDRVDLMGIDESVVEYCIE